MVGSQPERGIGALQQRRQLFVAVIERVPAIDWCDRRAGEPGGRLAARQHEVGRSGQQNHSPDRQALGAWEGRLSPTMRQVHPAGERMFVDYAGQTIELIDGRSGEIRNLPEGWTAISAVLCGPSYRHA